MTLEKATAIYVRNEESRDYLRNYGLKKYVGVTSDLALTFDVNDIPVEYKMSAKKALERFEGKRIVFIHVNLLNIFSNKKNKIEIGCDYLVKDIVTFSKNHPDVAFVIGSDYESTKVEKMNEYIYNALGEDRCILIKNYNVWGLAGFLSSVDVILTTKLHVGIVGTSLGKTVISFSGDQKIHRFYKQIGIPERSIELKDVKSGDCLKQIEKYIFAKPIDITVQRRNAEVTLQKAKEFVESVQ